MAASSESVFIATLYTSTLYLKYTHTRRRRSPARPLDPRESSNPTGTRRARRVSITRERHTTHVTHERCTIHERGIHERYTRGTHERYSIHDRGFRGAQRPADPTSYRPVQPHDSPAPLRPLACLSPPPLHTPAPHSASTASAQRPHSASHRSAARRRWRATYVRPTCHLRARSTCLPPPRRTPAPHACGSPP